MVVAYPVAIWCWCCIAIAHQYHLPIAFNFNNLSSHQLILIIGMNTSIGINANASLQVEKAEKVSARVEPSVTARFFVTTSKVLPSLRSDVSHVVVVSNVFQLVSHRLLGLSSPLTHCSDLRRDPWCPQDLPRRCHP